MQAKFVTRKNNTTVDGTNWKIQPLPEKSYHKVIEILNDSCQEEISNSQMPGELGKDIALIEEKPAFRKDALRVNEFYQVKKTRVKVDVMFLVVHFKIKVPSKVFE